MIKAIAIDDEPLALEVIKNHFQEFKGVELTACFTNAVDMYSFLEVNDIRLIFLDIHLKEASGVDIANSLKDKYAIIFTTAHTDYALQGYDLDVVDYLLKPIGYKRFAAACNKFLSRYAQLVSTELLVKQGNTIHKIDAQDILYLESAGNYVKLYFANRFILSRSTLKEIIRELPLGMFVRTHKSFAINKAKVTAIEPTQVWLKNISIPISSSFKEKVISGINRGEL
ncbi:response regulator [Chitinophaga oryziterrae]|uniref:Response regulator n=1 Tax=Chitinophaga oryziterrae TaxID=1031224 RepID=A0A6N8J246_9BACT|nr:LytTR family DNA-binding domain-containing protein [Chitinophaga oryziterrae]MVT39260.1 response regulator [Chitinophaga oryziterrae]